MKSSELVLTYFYLLSFSQFSDSLNAPLNTTYPESSANIMDVSTDVSATTADTYGVSSDVSSTKADIYDVTSDVSATTADTYDVSSDVSVTTADTYDVSTDVSATTADTYGVSTGIIATRFRKQYAQTVPSASIANDFLKKNATRSRKQHAETVPSALIATRVVDKYVIVMLAVLGICGNVVNLLVWSGESGFNPTTFFIKMLAVSDIALLVHTLFGQYIWLISNILLLGLELYSRVVTVHATLAVVITRWIAVYKPTQMKTLLSKRRVIIGCLLTVLWCFLAGLPFMINYVYFPSYMDTAQYATFTVCMTLPVVVLVCLNVSLVYKLCRHRRDSSLHTGARATRSSRFYRLLLAVVCLSVTTTIAYPVGIVARVLVIERVTGKCDIDCIHLVLTIGSLLEVFNSSVNVVYYLLFASQFRELFIQRLRCCVCEKIHCCVCRRKRASDLAMRTTMTPTELADNQ